MLQAWRAPDAAGDQRLTKAFKRKVFPRKRVRQKTHDVLGNVENILKVVYNSFCEFGKN